MRVRKETLLNANKIARFLIPLVVLAAFLYFVAHSNSSLFHGGDNVKQLKYSVFLQDVDAGLVNSGDLDKDTFDGKLTNGSSFTVDLPPDNPNDRAWMLQEMHLKGVVFGVKRPPIPEGIMAMLLSFVLPLGVIFFFWMFFSAAGASPAATRPSPLAAPVPSG